MRPLCATVTLILTLISFNTTHALDHEETLALVSKNPTTWRIDTTAATAQLTFNHHQNTFTCSGQRLEQGQHYALIQHDDSCPRGHGFIVSVGTSTEDGTLSLAGQWSNWHGKIWLVLAEDVRGGAGDEQLDQLIHWRPTRYLFESHPLL